MCLKVHAAPWLVVVNVLLGTITVSLNNSALNPALPTFIRVFSMGPVAATWIIAAFMTSMGVTMPLTGWLSKRLGRKRLYLSGLVLFLAGSCSGALAGSGAEVTGARVIQGIASGLMIPVSLSLIFVVYDKQRRGRITGMWGGAVMLATALGPLFGSLVLEWFGWQALFLLNVPVGLAALLTGIFVLPDGEATEKRPFDLTGYLLIAGGIVLLLISVGRLHTPLALLEWRNALMLAGAMVCLGLFTRRALSVPDPLLNLRLFALRGYRLSVIIAVIQSVGMFECLVLVPVLIQLVLGYSAFYTGLALLITAVSAGACGQIGGRLLDQQGARGVVSLGVFITGIATLLLGLVGVPPLWLVLLLMLIRGAGLGLSYMPVTTAGLNVLPDDMVTQGSAMNNISRRLGASLAIVAGALWMQYRMDGDAYSQAEAIDESFVITGIMILLVLPCAWRFPADDSVSRRQAQVSAERKP
ncbi:DHA2 family efflux MFS transporter permease subunit [Xenorhabdus sp. DI]|uniref:DHA2 family efflux MFS transporter permease subunit n=1 Tax=Xenorhabdus doucetiae TaxID=351671 RepID=UPI0019962F47|nr:MULTISPECIES: DHA2 family efflux MFS transporter permease subunit [unclassified Xenorhabdus]MBD2785260.1 DHA2 family efflux MFS transporter permease subunit [Xenorhabdus sp. 3]MBD2789303.1 DHA2 family efflux MFS transporter permease subunit [Xenorhabdus sp. DI]MBD2795036.1 DHA2 family efflux MFS transporter permease subunit [Xenorhabdus sp. 18]